MASGAIFDDRAAPDESVLTHIYCRWEWVRVWDNYIHVVLIFDVFFIFGDEHCEKENNDFLQLCQDCIISIHSFTVFLYDYT